MPPGGGEKIVGGVCVVRDVNARIEGMVHPKPLDTA